MINLITGLPGASKTLFTISWVKKWSEQDKRPVFYSGIPDLDKDKLGWTEIEAEKWFECPAGSIVIIDECQRVFRPRTISKEVPEYVSKLETHRHLGIDLVLITQHPLLADSAIRRLTGNHRHIVRRFGMQSSTIHMFHSVRDNCDKTAGRKDSEKTVWAFDKSVFNLYKSAEIHTVKRSIPKRIWFIVAAPVLIAFAVYSVYRFTQKQKEPATLAAQHASADGTASGFGSAPAKSDFRYKTAEDDAREFVFENTPRVAGLEHTAPKYDKLTEPTVAPYPVGCVKTKSSCTCYSQQATPVSTPQEMCENIVKSGIFQDFEVNPERRRGDDSDRVVARSEPVNQVKPVEDTPMFEQPSERPVFVPHKKSVL